MQIIFYQSSAEVNRVDKSKYLLQSIVLNGTLREPTSIATPSLSIKYNDVPNFNYMYIEDFKRYYFITNIVSVRNGLWAIKGECDVLMSFKEDIFTHSAIVKRTNRNDIPNQNVQWQIDELLPLESFKRTSLSLLAKSDKFKPTKSNYSIILNITDVESVEDIKNTDSSISNGLTIPSNIYSQTGKSYRTYLFFNEYNYQLFIKAIIGDNSLSSQILSAYAFPFNFYEWCTQNGIELELIDHITVGSTSLSAKAWRLPSITVPFLQFNFNLRASNSWQKREPYSTYELLIPYYGLLPLNTSTDFMDDTTLTYIIDFTNGMCEGILNHDNIIIKTFTFQLGTVIPISSSGVAEANRANEAAYIRYQAQLEAASYQLAGSVISSITGGVSSGLNAFSNAGAAERNQLATEQKAMFNSEVTGQPQIISNNRGNIGMGLISGVGGYAINAIGGIGSSVMSYMATTTLAEGNYKAQTVLNVPYGTTHNFGSTLFVLFSYCDLYLITRSYNALVDANNLALLKGYPCNLYIPLTYCKGFTQITDIKLQIGSAWQPEVDAIKQLLFSGVLFED